MFTTTDILDLTGPFAASGFTLRPGLVEQDRQASIEVSGAGCRPNGSALSRVKGSVFGHGDARRGDGTGYQAPFEVDARSDGTWRTTITVPPDWARGSYGIQASCDGQVFATQSFHFVAGSQLAAPATAVARSSGSVLGATPAQPVKAVPRFTG